MAFYQNVPVIATNVGGIPEIVEDQKTGLLVSPNDPQKLLESINNLIKNPEMAKSLGISGHNFIINNFSWDHLLPKYIEFYKNLK